MIRKSVLLAFFLFLPGFLNGAVKTEIVYFYEAGCPHCKRVTDFLENRIIGNYPVIIKRYEIHNANNADTLRQLAYVYRSRVKTPTVFIGDKVVQDDNRSALRKIELYVSEAVKNQAPSPLSRLGKGTHRIRQQITIPILIGAAAADAINPCAFAVLTILLSTILLSSKKRRRVLGAGLAFTASTFLSYFLMGFGLFSVIRTFSVQYYLYIIIAILAVLIGLWHLKDFLWYGRWLTLEVPNSWRPKLKQITSGVTSVTGAFFIGFIVSLFLLPCSSGPYVVVIGMLSGNSTRTQAIWLLLLYNFIFVLPFIIITLGVTFGFTTTQRLERFQLQNLEILHLVMGIVLFILGVSMIFLVATGKI